MTDWRRPNNPLRKEQMRVWRRKSELKRKYGLTLEQYDKLFKDQKGLCALCYRPPLPKKRMAVDHCHSTGRIRGLLCEICNRHVIGNRDLSFFERCVLYLKEPKVDEQR